MHTKTDINYGQIIFVNKSLVNGVRWKWLQGILGGWNSLIAFARMLEHFNRLGQTLSLHSAYSFRCPVMPLSDLRISRAPSSEASSSEALSSNVVFFSAAHLDWLRSTMVCFVSTGFFAGSCCWWHLALVNGFQESHLQNNMWGYHALYASLRLHHAQDAKHL